MSPPAAPPDHHPSPADQPLADPAAAEAEAAASADGDPPPDWLAYVPTDVADHLATMDRAARESNCGVPWQLLAAISRVESDFGRNMATSSAGAVGYGQFLPSSWDAYGNAGNVYDYRDALPAIAGYLCQAGLERDPRSALFAYNHADWYVDLVLNLAVRYDRMAPGAPTPDVLSVGPATEDGPPLQYAAGRDVRLQARARTANAEVWLGVPWHGRTPGAPISSGALEATSLAMLRDFFGLDAVAPQALDSPDGELTGFANHAWEAGLLPLPIEPPPFHAAADRQPPLDQTLLGQIQRQIELGRPVVALVDGHSLPGHPASAADGDELLLIVGRTPDGLVYNDPSFSSSLGYGLELKAADFLAAWQAASTPFQALAFTPRPRPLPRQAHLRQAEPPPVYARVAYTPTPVPPPPTPTLEPTLPPVVVVDEPTPIVALAAETTTTDASQSPPADDRSWVIVLGATAWLTAAFVFRRVRARPTA